MVTLCLILTAAFVTTLVLLVAALEHIHHQDGLLQRAQAAHRAAEQRLTEVAPHRARRLIAVGPERPLKDHGAETYRADVAWPTEGGRRG